MYEIISTIIFVVFFIWSLLVVIKHYSAIGTYSSLLEQYGNDIFTSIVMMVMAVQLYSLHCCKQPSIKRLAIQVMTSVIFIIIMIYLHQKY